MRWMACLVGLAVLGTGGCTNAVKTTAHDPVGTIEIKPTLRDKDAGLVAMAPGFELKAYGVIGVDRFPVSPTETKEGEDRDLASSMSGYRTLRFFVGYGVGRSKAQVEMHFTDAQSGHVVMVTADRRVAAHGLFGGDSEGHLRESFEEMARDLSRFLQRLAKR